MSVTDWMEAQREVEGIRKVIELYEAMKLTRSPSRGRLGHGLSRGKRVVAKQEQASYETGPTI